ncbi:hypothetical protein RRG08_007003 [Elysia crispata]|uniref:Uncharacterized protein n=1 Tax=Elysia crispata TaxID=231223 RepID=A0AAE0XYK4_9GAST|nr:hypothetical protein RRG08_007003 [Elysia crispata]
MFEENTNRPQSVRGKERRCAEGVVQGSNLNPHDSNNILSQLFRAAINWSQGQNSLRRMSSVCCCHSSNSILRVSSEDKRFDKIKRKCCIAAPFLERKVALHKLVSTVTY